MNTRPAPQNKKAKKNNTLRATKNARNFPPGENKDAVERAIAHGVDITLLEQSLKLTPTQRLENFQRWLDFAEEVRRAGEEMRRTNVTRRKETV